MRFSIIVPVYNVELYLADCLESILNQSYQDFEIICINDASTDQSYDILLEYAKKNKAIKLIDNCENRGLSASRNQGVDKAKGDYILFLDSDDMLCENALSILNDIVEEKEVEIVGYRYSIKNEGRIAKESNMLENEAVVFSEKMQTGQALFKEMAQMNLFLNSVCTLLYKHDFLEKNELRFYEGILYEDILFFFRSILVASKVIYTHQFLYIYRRRDHSITSTIDKIIIDSAVIMLGDILTKWYTCKLEDGMDEAIKKYIHSRMVPLLNKGCLLYPNYRKIMLGTKADQFVFDLFCGIVKKESHYVQLTNSEIEHIKSYEQIIIYGAGAVAAELIIFLRNCHINIGAVAVSDININKNEIANIKVYQIDELSSMCDRALVIVAVLSRSQPRILEKLKNLKFRNIICIDTERIQ